MRGRIIQKGENPPGKSASLRQLCSSSARTVIREAYLKGLRLNRLLKKSQEQIPRGLKPARDDKNKKLGGAPFGRLRAGPKRASRQKTRRNRLFQQPRKP